MKTLQDADTYDNFKNDDTWKMFWIHRKKEIRSWNGSSILCMVIYAIVRYFNEYDILPIELQIVENLLIFLEFVFFILSLKYDQINEFSMISIFLLNCQ